jgi:hypothetical protein
MRIQPHKHNYKIVILDANKCKILNETLACQIQQHIKNIIHPEQVEFISRIQGLLNTWKSINVLPHIGRMKEKTMQVISTDAEKAFDKIQHLFIGKTKLIRYRWKYFNIIRPQVINQQLTLH